MSYDYTGIIATAGRLIERFGRDITRTRSPDAQVINPVTGVKTGGDDTTATVIGINQRIPTDAVDGTRVLSTDRMLVLRADAEPRMSDRFDGWSVQEIQEIKPATSSIVWFVRIRK